MTKVYMATKSDLEQVKAAFNANDTTNVGYITWQMCLMKNYLKLNGMPLVNAGIDYADLLQFAVDHELITTDVNDKALFKYDETEDVLTLPDYMDLCLQGGTMVKTEQAGLPNITGECSEDSQVGLCVANPIMKGAFYKGNSIAAYPTCGNDSRSATLMFDASRSSTVYGASTTVQPPAIKLIPQIKYRYGADGQVNYGDGTPLGTIIMFMGTVAPANYLFCDGTTYAIADYPALTAFIAKQFGSVNHFGGDGETTFAVPDLRGEFLRCTGTNRHINSGNGADVGVHQDGTTIPYISGYSESINDTGAAQLNIRFNPNAAYNFVLSGDSYGRHETKAVQLSYNANRHTWQEVNSIYSFTSRPTNTSVMYCIKAKAGDEQ